MMRNVTAALLLFPAAMGAAAQGAWTGLGGSATAGGLSNTLDGNSVEPCVAISPAGTLYASWTEWLEDGQKVRVSTWDAAKPAWVELGDGLDDAATNYLTPLSIIRVGADERPVVAWIGGGGLFGGHIYLKRWSGTEWQELGGSASGDGVSIDGTGIPTSPSMALDASGNPVVAWQSSAGMIAHVFVRGWDGAAWRDWTGSSTAGIDAGLTGGFFPALALDSAGNPSVAFWGNPGFLFLVGELHVRTWSSASGWKDVGDAAVTASQLSLQHSSLAIDLSGSPVVAWTYPAKDNEGVNRRYLMVERWNGLEWTGLAGNPAVADTIDAWPMQSMTITPWNETLIAWVGDGSIVYVKSLKAGATIWEPIGESYGEGGISGLEGNPSNQPCIAAGPSGLVAVAWSDTLQGAAGNAGEIRLKRAMIDPKASAWNLRQMKGDGKSPLPTGEAVASGSTVVLGGVVIAGTEASAALEVELRPVGTAFQGLPTQTGLTLAAPISCTLPVAGLADGTYHWQARVKTESGKTSSWTAFGANPENEPDFAVGVAAPPPPPPVASDAGGGKKKSGCLGSGTGSAAAWMLLLIALAPRR